MLLATHFGTWPDGCQKSVSAYLPVQSSDVYCKSIIELKTDFYTTDFQWKDKNFSLST